MQTHLDFVLADREAREAFFYDKRADAMVALTLICHRKDNEDVSHIAVGDKDLGTVEHVMISLQSGDRLAFGGVRAGIWLSQRERTDMAACGQHRQVFLLLFFGAVRQDRVAAKPVMCSYDIACGRAVFRKLFHRKRRG